jgi:prepilin-type N-terminal cleavage/methylation domain-containing protein
VARSEAGFTVIEVLVAVTLLGISLAAVLSVMALGLSSADTGRRSSTALFLAEQRLEQIRAFAVSPDPVQGLANVTTAVFAAEGYNTLAGYGDYRRAVAVTDDPGGVANTKLVRVDVFYRPLSMVGISTETSVTVSTLLALR